MSGARQSITAERLVNRALDRRRAVARVSDLGGRGGDSAHRPTPCTSGSAKFVLGTFSRLKTYAGRQRDSGECPLLSDSVLFLLLFLIEHWAWWWKANAKAVSSEQDERRSPRGSAPPAAVVSING